MGLASTSFARGDAEIAEKSAILRVLRLQAFQALERDPAVTAIVGVSEDDPTCELTRTEFVRVGNKHALLRRIVDAAAIDTVIDINPAKQGRYLAGTGLRVQSPEEAMAHLPDGADVFVMNSNYLREIQAATAHRYHCLLIDQGNAT